MTDNKITTIYVCTKLSAKCEEQSHYDAVGYRQLAISNLNKKDQTKHLFVSLKKAQEFLETNGAQWCIYTVTVPTDEVKSYTSNSFMGKPDNVELFMTHHFQYGDIQNIEFHSTLFLEDITLESATTASV